MKKKENKTLIGLRLCYNKDFKSKEICFASFEVFERELIDSIKSSDRSIKDQKIEAIAKLEQNKHRNHMSRIAMIISFISLLVTFFTKYLDTEMILDNEIFATAAYMLICLILIVEIMVLIAGDLNKRIYENISYYTIKLNCIEKIEKDKKIAVRRRLEKGKIKY